MSPLNFTHILTQAVDELSESESYKGLFHQHTDGNPLPSAKVLRDIIELARAIIFPGYFGNSTVNSRTVTYHIGVNVERLFDLLTEQILAGLCFAGDGECNCCTELQREEAALLAAKFISNLPAMRRTLATDVEAAYNGDPAAQSFGEVISCYPAIRAISNYRIAHELLKLGVPLIPRIITEMAHSETGIDIHPGAEIGGYFTIDHGPGVASPVYKLMYLGSSTREINEGVSRIDRILENQPVSEPACPKIPATYDIEFRHVSFSYENKEQATRTEALHDLCFTAPQGKITAFVGPSGSGKSTVANLIPRFWDVEQGEILIGNVNVKDIATEQLMDLVSFVFQDTFLFYDTLYENIAVGSSKATRDTVIAAARAAQCHEFIEKLPNGYETRIGDKGVFLSGGEAQRVCVARAILKNAPILVLDEATAFADPENEYKMQQALKSLIKDKTVIIIAHRLSSIVSSDRIIVLKDGRAVQCGRHEELSSQEGVYKKMWNAYTSAFRWQLNVKQEKE